MSTPMPPSTSIGVVDISYFNYYVLKCKNNFFERFLAIPNKYLNISNKEL